MSRESSDRPLPSPSHDGPRARLGPGHGRDRYADLALGVYAEDVVGGRHVLVVGDATSGLAERLVEIGARHVTVADPDVVRARLTTARLADVRIAPWDGGPLPFAGGAFGAAFVPDLGAVDGPALVDELARVLGEDAVLVAAAGNPDAPRGLASERAAVPYYELYEMLSARFPAVRMLGQSPFVGWAVVDFGAADGDSAVTLDGSLVEIPEDPERFVALCAATDVALEPYVVVQAPMVELLGGDDTATEIGAPVGPAEVIARAVAEAESRVRAEVASTRAELDGARAELDRTAGELAATERELEATRSHVADVETARRAAHMRVDELSARVAELTEEIEARDDERDAQNAYAEDIERELAEKARGLAEKDRGLADKDRALADKDRALAALRDELGQRTREVESAAARVAELVAAIDEREAALSVVDEERIRLARELTAARSEIELLRASQAEDSSGDIDALERAMRQQGDELRALESEVVRRDGLIRGLVAELAEARAGHGEGDEVTVPLESTLETPREAVLRAGLGQAHAELAEVHAASAREASAHAREIEELRGELANAREQLVQAEARRTATSFRVDEISSELLVARAESDRTKAELIAARAAEGEAQQAARRALEETRALSEALDDVDEDRARVSGALLGALRRVAELEVERDARARANDVEPWKNEVESARFEAKTLATEIETMRGREAELVGRIRGLALRNRELTTELEDASKRAARADEDAWSSLASRTALTSTASELEDRCRRAEVERGSALERVAELEANVRALRERADDAGMEIARMRAIEASLSERMLDVQQDAERAQKRVDELEVREDALKLEAARLNALASSFQDRAEGLAQELEGTKRGFRARLSELSAELDRRAHRERIVAGEAKFLRERMQEWTERLEAGEKAATKALEDLASRSDELTELEASLARANELAASLAGERDGLRLRLVDRSEAWANLRERLARAEHASTPGADRTEDTGRELASLRGERDGLRLRARDRDAALAARTDHPGSVAAVAPEAARAPAPAPRAQAPSEPAAADLEAALVRASDVEAERRSIEERLALAAASLRERDERLRATEAELAEERAATKALRDRIAEIERSASDLKWYLGERDAKIRGLEHELRGAADKASAFGERLEQAARTVAETQSHLEARVRHLEGELSASRGRHAALEEQLATQRERLADAERRATEAAQRASEEGERRVRGAEEATMRDPQVVVLQREAAERDVLLRSLAAQLEERDDRVRMLEQRLQQVERERRVG
ncbi:MAG: hypothetical protein IT379_31830, partial [Deltaproteobacteria bacterium]|nr:hypothetical protein [Deltaproteobacteria bacterium]